MTLQINESSATNVSIYEKTEDDYFAFIMIRSNVAKVSITICTLCVIFIPILCYSIIWFDSYGSNKKRTFINMITSAGCFTTIEYFYFIQSTEILRYAIGPLPKWFCFLKTTLRSAYATQYFLYFNANALTRYLFIFWLKNPAAFPSDFWYLFLNIWIRGASLIFNGAWFYKAEHQIINFYICTGIDPTEDFKKPLKLYAVTELATVIINLFVWVRVQMYKKRCPKTEKNVTKEYTLNKIFFLKLNHENILNFTTDVVNISVISTLLFGAAYLSNVKPEDMKNYQIMLHLQYLVAPCFSAVVFLTVYYWRHISLQQAVLKKILELYMDFKELMFTLNLLPHSNRK